MIKREDIIKPLIFLDIFDYPPTAMELWRFLGVPAELGEVININSPLERGAEPGEAGCVMAGDTPSLIFSPNLNTPRPANPPRPSATPPKRGSCPPLSRGEYSGFYFLPGREELIEKRREFVYLAEKKFKIAKRAAWLLHFIPSVKMIAICNNFYYRPESDIDFLIITSPERLWLTRFCATIILDLLRLRARGKKTADKICLSFYLSEEYMNLEKIALVRNGSLLLEESDPCLPDRQASRGAQDDKNFGDDKNIDDPYLSYWLVFLEPIYGQDCYNKFWEANKWLKNIFPNALPKKPVSRRIIGDNFLSLGIKKIKGIWFYGAMGNTLEKITKKIQWQKLSPRVKEMSALSDTRVIINDAMLKFHENDRREEFRKNYKLRIINYK